MKGVPGRGEAGCVITFCVHGSKALVGPRAAAEICVCSGKVPDDQREWFVRG